ncbi:MAG TPA: PEP-utilizing enzyme [Patescibacteria group bacterium]|nr:PEP-utilizing enzyme [Patescibacteria group bacterium]
MEYKGVAAQGGKVQGRICLVKEQGDLVRCEPGDVLVLVGIKPDLSSVRRCVGIVAIHGGITSHAAIVARENGKPAVVGLQKEDLVGLEQAKVVIVDGDLGLVKVIE